jgi:Na+/H+ antiporter NhaC
LIKTIIYGILGALAILAVTVYHVPGFWIFLALIAFLLVKTFNPFRLSVETIPQGFNEKKFNTGEVILNYVEGPENGPPLLFIPGQMEFWQGINL